MWTKRRHLLAGLGCCFIQLVSPAFAGDLLTASPLPTQQAGHLRIAVYNDFAPYANKGKGIDVDIGKAIAERLALQAEIVTFNADEDMNDDLRNMVWKGHYLGTRPADLMMHVPVDQRLAQANPQVTILGPYAGESIAMARDPSRVNAPQGSAAVALEVFTREKVGVEIDSLADAFLLGALNGRLRDNVAHFRKMSEAAEALKAGKIAAIMAPRGELEAALAGHAATPITPVVMPELKVGTWAIGLALKADNPVLADAVGKALASLVRDGTVATIYKNHGITYQTTVGKPDA